MSDETSPTVELNGIEYDADDLSDALDQFEEREDRSNGFAVVGDVAVVGDGDDDACVYVAHPDEVSLSNVVSNKYGHNNSRPHSDAAYGNICDLRTLIDDAETTFVDYLHDEVFTLGGYTIEECDTYGDARVAEHDDGSGYIIRSVMDRAVEDPNVGFVTVNNGWLHLSDERNDE